MSKTLVPAEFRRQAIAFPDRVDALLEEIDSPDDAKDLLDKASTMKTYAQRLKAGIDIERPIAIGVLKIKIKLGELTPAKDPKDAGAMGGRGHKGIKPGLTPFSKQTMSGYRKLAKSQERLEDYVASIDDVPSQAGFVGYISRPHQSRANGKVEWYTPPEYIEAARKAMGSIDVDPASSEIAQRLIKAKEYYTEETDGLSKRWEGNVWLNPPYAARVVDLFAERLLEEIEAKRVKQAVLLVNNATDTRWFASLVPACSILCFTTGRVAFIDGQGGTVSGALQGQAILYFGRRVERFKKEFGGFGWMTRPE